MTSSLFQHEFFKKTSVERKLQKPFSISLKLKFFYFLKNKDFRGFPGGAVVKKPPANAGDTDSSPGPGRSHMPQSNDSHAPQLLSLRSRAREPQLLSPRATTTEPVCHNY